MKFRNLFSFKTKENILPVINEIDNKLQKLNVNSMSGLRAISNLYILGDDIIRRNIEGDIVECGVCNGGSAGALALGTKSHIKHVWLYDSFEGMPDVSEIDGEFAKKYVGKTIGSLELVAQSMDIADTSEENYTIRKGWFNDTFEMKLPDKIAILHIDCDWYESVILSLRTFYDKVQDGGVIIIDDFGHFEGCREAVYDFFNERKIKPLMERFGHTQMFWVKGRIHNRFSEQEKNSTFTKQFHQ